MTGVVKTDTPESDARPEMPNTVYQQSSKIGNYSSVCRSASSNACAAVSAAVEEVFLGALEFGSAWTKDVFINGVSVQMKINTGTDVTVIPETIY